MSFDLVKSLTPTKHSNRAIQNEGHIGLCLCILLRVIQSSILGGSMPLRNLSIGDL